MKSIKLIALIVSIFNLILVIGMGCAGVPPAPNPVIPTDTYACKAGCDHLLTLTGRDGHPGCEEARVLELPNGDIKTCEQFCTETQNNGRSIHPSCWVTLTKCNDIETSCRR